MAFDLNSIVFFIPFLALAVSVIALSVAIAIHFRIKKIFRSANVPDIERLIALHSKTLEEFVKFKAESVNYMQTLNARIKRKTNNASTLRFNPFQREGIGGNQSFASVFADEEGNGVVITSMQTRERTNVFAKPLKNWQSEYNLSEEELKVIGQAKGR
ncbi:MAG: DUF4446 family protein [Parcubacteria group bacterium]|jgi:hypothetical protein|nr:DUF4446 family protein [Parcubacteria group bacterium]